MANDLSLYTTADDDFKDMRASDVIMPRIALQQATSAGVTGGKYRMAEFIDLAQETAAISVKQVGKVVPLMYWLEWIEWNTDRAAPKEKRIIARSVDPAGALAKMAAQYVKINTPQGEKLRVTEYYNFIVLLPSYSKNYEDCFMLNFSKSSHKTGKAWLNKLMRAKIKLGDDLVKAPIWANEWELSATSETKDGNVYAQAHIGSGAMIPTDVHASVKALSDGLKAKRDEIMHKNAASDEDGGGDAPTDGDISAANGNTNNM